MYPHNPPPPQNHILIKFRRWLYHWLVRTLRSTFCITVHSWLRSMLLKWQVQGQGHHQSIAWVSSLWTENCQSALGSHPGEWWLTYSALLEPVVGESVVVVVAGVSPPSSINVQLGSNPVIGRAKIHVGHQCCISVGRQSLVVLW